MAWITKIPTPPEQRPCPLPKSTVERFAPNSVWRCDDCGTRWMFVGQRHGVASAQGDTYDSWAKVPEGTAGGTHA